MRSLGLNVELTSFDEMPEEELPAIAAE
jgi:hypothetical protein